MSTMRVVPNVVRIVTKPELDWVTVTEVSHWFDQCDSKRFDR